MRQLVGAFALVACAHGDPSPVTGATSSRSQAAREIVEPEPRASESREPQPRTTEPSPSEPSQPDPTKRARPPYRDGDIVFHESASDESELVRIVTRSRWTHLGVIAHDGDRLVVWEAAAPVKVTPFEAFVKRGRNGEYVVKRLAEAAESGLEAAAVAKMRESFETMRGRPYDYRFRWDDEALYCSEFVYKLFERARGVPVGRIERARDMALDEPVVRLAIRLRFGDEKYDPDEPVVTPDSIFRDPNWMEVEAE